MTPLTFANLLASLGATSPRGVPLHDPCSAADHEPPGGLLLNRHTAMGQREPSGAKFRRVGARSLLDCAKLLRLVPTRAGTRAWRAQSCVDPMEDRSVRSRPQRERSRGWRMHMRVIEGSTPTGCWRPRA